MTDLFLSFLDWALNRPLSLLLVSVQKKFIWFAPLFSTKEIKTSKIAHNNMFTQYKRSWIHRISYTKVKLIWNDICYSLFGILLFYPYPILSRSCELSRWVWVKSRLNRSGWRYPDWLLCLYTIKWSIRSSVGFEALQNPSKEGRYHLQRKCFIQWFKGKKNLLGGVIYLIW